MVASLAALVFFLPNLAVTVRRLHDVGRSGFWLLLVLVPVIGALIVLVFLLLESQREPNKWGPLPVGA